MTEKKFNLYSDVCLSEMGNGTWRASLHYGPLASIVGNFWAQTPVQALEELRDAVQQVVDRSVRARDEIQTKINSLL